MLINEGEITKLNLEVFSQDISTATTNSETGFIYDFKIQIVLFWALGKICARIMLKLADVNLGQQKGCQTVRSEETEMVKYRKRGLCDTHTHTKPQD